jgi:hypothetical protein
MHTLLRTHHSSGGAGETTQELQRERWHRREAVGSALERGDLRGLRRATSEHGIGALWDDARKRGADLIVIPEELADGGVLDRLRGDRLDDQTLADAPTAVMVVDDAGNRILPR